MPALLSTASVSGSPALPAPPHAAAPRGAAGAAGAATVPAVARALSVLELLARERRPMHMAGVAAALSLPRSSVHGLCSTLLSFGYLKRAEGGALQIGPGVMSLAEAFVAGTTVAGEFDALWREVPPPDETLILSVLSGAEVVYVAVRNSARPLGLAFTVGMRLPAHVAASGKALLSQLAPAELRALLPPRTVGAALLQELADVRERGYSIDDGGVRHGVYAIAAPVFDAAGQAVAGISVCLNKAALDAAAQQRQRALVLDAARRLSQRLGAGPSTAAPSPSPAPRAGRSAARSAAEPPRNAKVSP